VLRVLFLVSTVSALGLQLVTVVTTTLLSMLSPGLALRGPDGSMHTAVDGMVDEYRLSFYTFMLGLIATHFAAAFFVWRAAAPSLPTSPPPLPHLSPTSPPPLPHISPTSPACRLVFLWWQAAVLSFCIFFSLAMLYRMTRAHPRGDRRRYGGDMGRCGNALPHLERTPASGREREN